jgi:hypothetical protein
MSPSTQRPLSEPTKEQEALGRVTTREETVREDDDANATPKDIRFWLIILGLLIATFISALDLTGKLFIF